MYTAIKSEDYGKIQSLIAEGCDINAPMDRYEYGTHEIPLKYACLAKPKMAHFILSNGGDPNLCQNIIYTLLEKREFEVIELLLKYGLNINFLHDNLPIYTYCFNIKMLKTMTKYGLNYTFGDCVHKYVQNILFENPYFYPIIDYLYEIGVFDPDTCDKDMTKYYTLPLKHLVIDELGHSWVSALIKILSYDFNGTAQKELLKETKNMSHIQIIVDSFNKKRKASKQSVKASMPENLYDGISEIITDYLHLPF